MDSDDEADEFRPGDWLHERGWGTGRWQDVGPPPTDVPSYSVVPSDWRPRRKRAPWVARKAKRTA
ncbi:MAG TPA: hypothetical protein VFQ85_03015 [Mycobacteriales bacterium]|jgi:hypothetical protein|nr:hypothetical protein [Mycobacteriales bacterium]